MQFYIGCAVLILFICGCFMVIKRPQISLALFLGLYAAEQILMANFPVFRQFGSLYNYFVGAVCVLAMMSSVFKFGMPRIDRLDFLIFVFFFMIVSASLLWTPSPISAKFAYTHFALEASLAVLLSMFVIRKEEDIKLFVKFLVGFALLTSFSLIFAPKAGIGGRIVLVDGGTVLSPATLSGACIILLSCLSKNSLGNSLHKLRYGIILVLALGCFLSGARTQFYVSVFLSGYALLFIFGKQKLKLMGGLIASTIAAALVAVFFLPAEFWDGINQVAQRYEGGRFDTGINQRVSMLISVLGSKEFLIGNGLMSWGFLSTGGDVYVYPHNSLAQAYYELGIVGLFLFMSFIAAGIFSAVKALDNFKKIGANTDIVWGFLLYLIYGVLLSFKQGTFMSCVEVYVGVSILGTYYLMSKKSLKYKRWEALQSAEAK